MEDEKRSLLLYQNHCLWLLATDKRAPKMKSYSDLQKIKEGKIIIDNRTSQQIISDTRELFR